jgi:iron(III) transport system substrate-binding protein
VVIRRDRPGPKQLSLRALVGLIAAMLALPLMAACGTRDSGGTGSTAEAQRALTVYSGRSEELVGPLFAQFTEQTGIKVEARYGDTAELAAQLLEEGAGSPAQVFFAQDAGALGAVEAAGLFAALPEKAATAVPAPYRAPDGTWTGVTGRARVIVYDPQQVPADQVPRSVLDLTDPKWRSQVAIAPTNASFQSFVTAMRIADGDDTTRKWLKGMVDNDAQRYEKNGLILDAVDAGQVKLGLINHYYWYEKAAEVGEAKMRSKIAFTAPGDPGSLVNVAGAGILKPAADNKEAAEFLEWLLAPETQQWFVANTYEYPLLPNVPAAEGLPPLESLRGPDVALADLDSLPATLSMLEDVGLL